MNKNFKQSLFSCDLMHSIGGHVVRQQVSLTSITQKTKKSKNSIQLSPQSVFRTRQVAGLDAKRKVNMEPPSRILLTQDMARLFRVSIPTIYRWLRQTRKGERDFILPISAPGATLRWLASDAEAFLESQSSKHNASPQKIKSHSKRQEISLQKRQAAAAISLKKHAVGRKAK